MTYHALLQQCRWVSKNSLFYQERTASPTWETIKVLVNKGIRHRAPRDGVSKSFSSFVFRLSSFVVLFFFFSVNGNLGLRTETRGHGLGTPGRGLTPPKFAKDA